MAFVSTAPNVYLADDLARFVDLPSSFRGQKIQFVPISANVSKNNVVYFPFESEKEADDWIEQSVSEWWDDETV
jgi:hypothetical protein